MMDEWLEKAKKRKGSSIENFLINTPTKRKLCRE